MLVHSFMTALPAAVSLPQSLETAVFSVHTALSLAHPCKAKPIVAVGAAQVPPNKSFTPNPLRGFALNDPQVHSFRSPIAAGGGLN
jgi:hypothetical protein